MNYIGILKLRNTDTEINNLMDEFTTTETWKRNSVCQKNRSENIPNEAKREKNVENTDNKQDIGKCIEKANHICRVLEWDRRHI